MGADVIAAAEALVPLVAEAADEIEAAGRLPDKLVDALTDADLFRMYVPAALGGPEVDPLTAMAAIEVLATADASLAWCAHVSTANAWQLATLDPAAVATMEQPGGGARRFSGSARPLGRAVRVDGGYRVSGRWDFASNCLHAQWYCGTCVVEEDGRRRTRAMFVPIDAGEIVPTWQVAGLRGTGSHDFEVHDVFVPDEFASSGRHLAAHGGPLYRPRLIMVVNWALTAGVALGIARGALDAFAELSRLGTAGTVDTPLRDRATVQAAMGRSEATLAAARAYCYQSIGELWRALDANASEVGNASEPGNVANAGEADRADPAGRVGDDVLDRLVPPARLAIVHALHATVEVANTLFHAGGTRAIFHTNRLERYFRDAHVAAQHGAGAPSHFEAGGRLALGLSADAPYW